MEWNSVMEYADHDMQNIFFLIISLVLPGSQDLKEGIVLWNDSILSSYLILSYLLPLSNLFILSNPLIYILSLYLISSSYLFILSYQTQGNRIALCITAPHLLYMLRLTSYACLLVYIVYL